MNINLYENFFASLSTSGNQAWKTTLYDQLKDIFSNPPHSHFVQWENAVNKIPHACTSHFKFTNAVIEIGKKNELTKKQASDIISCLHSLLPWRKGPFDFFGTFIDAEWRSDQKWNRLQPHLPSLKDKLVLDVGCGNGYYLLRMLGAGAKQVIGVDPNLLFSAQFYAITQCIENPINAHLLPLAMEYLPSELNNFDYVFSMGVLYHRRNPLDHLKLLYRHTAPGGQVYVETLVIDNSISSELIPEKTLCWHA